eukprot:3754872-Rhodomonas_salina.2
MGMLLRTIRPWSCAVVPTITGDADEHDTTMVFCLIVRMTVIMIGMQAARAVGMVTLESQPQPDRARAAPDRAVGSGSETWPESLKP